MNKTPVQVGYLKHEGYSVGQQGPPVRKRHEILDYCYQHGIVPPSVFPECYIKEWGAPGTSARLQKMANCLHTFRENTKNQPSPSTDAIEDWKADLTYLRSEYDEDRYSDSEGLDFFTWPGSTLF